ncbi:MAG: alpha/beta hydrolase family protein [Chitinivibrionales bacterium]|nr:alpha/beta hydrolase family protein [Chitinivibrionales bacterium]
MNKNQFSMASVRIQFILFFFFCFVHAAEIQTISIPSAAMEESYPAIVVLPDAYHKSSMRFSVMYLLHGYSGNYRTWSTIVPLDSFADRYNLIFVCPDGNYNSWYLDSPRKPQSRFETYIAREMPHYIDSLFRTQGSRLGRAIMGSSMGGHGALTLLARHPDIFCGAAGLSGIMDLTEFPKNWDIAGVLGDYSGNRNQWREHSFVGMIDKLGNTNGIVMLDCGRNDFALPGNRRAHELLTALGIKHDYREMPGSHCPEYVRQNAEYHVRYLSNTLKKPR